MAIDTENKNQIILPLTITREELVNKHAFNKRRYTDIGHETLNTECILLS